MSLKMKWVLAAGLGLAGVQGARGANLLVNGGFELPVISPQTAVSLTGGSDIGGWTVVNPSGDTGLVVSILDTTYAENGGTLVFQAQEGQQALDITGPGNHGLNGVAQAVSGLTVGGTYHLSLWLGNQDDRYGNYPFASSVSVLVNGVQVAAFSNDDNSVNQLTWNQYGVDFAAGAETSTITILSTTASGDNETGLDNVSLTAVVPEAGASSFALAAAAGALGLARRRK